MNESFEYLRNFQLEKGYELYRKRIEYTDHKEWKVGTNIEKKILCIILEQSIGDVIFFARFINFIKCKKKLVLINHKYHEKCIPLLKHFGIEIIYEPVGYDSWVFICDLGSHFTNIVPVKKYIFSEEETISKWKAKLNNSKKKFIGLNLINNDLKKIHKNEIDFILNKEEYIFINLNIDCSLDHPNVIEFKDLDEKEPFIDTKAILEIVDLCITCDSCVAHLSGAMNIRTILLLTTYHYWYWHKDVISRWYPSITIFKKRLNVNQSSDAHKVFCNWVLPKDLINSEIENKSDKTKFFDSLGMLAKKQFQFGFAYITYRKGQKFNQDIKIFDETRPENGKYIKHEFLTEKEWYGQTLDNKKLIVILEMGIGDCVSYIHFMKLLTNKALIYVFAPNKYLTKCFSLFENSFGENVKFIDKVTSYDFWIYLCDLPKVLEINQVPEFKTYIHNRNEKLTEYWRNKLKITAKKLVGLNLQGCTGHLDSRQIAVSSIENLLNYNEFLFINLNIDRRINHKNVLNFDNLDKEKPFIDTLAILSIIDLLITSDTSIVHIAGAMGIKTILLLNRTIGVFWMWYDNFRKNNYSLWYPSVYIIDGNSSGIKYKETSKTSNKKSVFLHDSVTINLASFKYDNLLQVIQKIL